MDDFDGVCRRQRFQPVALTLYKQMTHLLLPINVFVVFNWGEYSTETERPSTPFFQPPHRVKGDGRHHHGNAISLGHRRFRHKQGNQPKRPRHQI